MFSRKGTRENKRREGSISQSPSLRPLAFSSHQRPQEALMRWRPPTHRSVSHTYISFSPPTLKFQSRRRKAHLHVLLALSDLVLPLLCWRLDESTDPSFRLNPMTQSQQYSVVIPLFTEQIQTPMAFFGPVQSGWTTQTLILSKGQEHQWQPPLFSLIQHH